MATFKSLALAALVSGASASERELSFARICGYEPSTNVVDRAVIDLDQKAIVNLVGEQTTESFNAAESVYRDGGNSKSYAAIELTSGLTSAAGKGAAVSGVTGNEDGVSGTLMEDASSGATQVKVQYKTSDTADNSVGCKVGGLPKDMRVTAGCLAASGKITIDGVVYDYTYNEELDNMNGRTIRGFSTAAKQKMYDTPPEPHPEYVKFYKYYGVFDYADQWVSAALKGTSTSGFTNYNANFRSFGLEGRAECVKKGTAYMNIFMYVIREFRDAVDDCNAGKTKDNDDAVVAWDEGVAFYAGSLEGTDGSGDGNLIYNLADKRCQDFKTCGPNGNELKGTSKVNLELFKLFSQGQGEISNGKCDKLEQTVDKISSLMFIPLIQGTMRYAHKVDKLAQGEKSKAEGAVFAASVLPMVAACSPDDAKTIASSMQVGASSTSYAQVVEAFENNYKCMGINNNADVGRLFDSASGEAYSLTDSPAPTFSMVGATVGAVAATLFTFIMI